MQQDNEARLEEGFAGALAQPLRNRAAFLQDFCGEDWALRKEIEELLIHDGIGFLDSPILELDSVRELLSTIGFDTGRHVGPYKILEELGRGGGAIVYRAERADGSFDKQVAIKVFNNLYSDGDEVRFRQELRILGQLDTPHIAKILDAGEEDGLTYFVMEYVDGSHIDVYCKRHHLTTSARLRLFLQVCDAVSLAHNNRIVHRDLKPANIMVDKSGSPKLIDFGIAKVLDARANQPVTVQGLEKMTFLYASPEQLSGTSEVAALPASDVYSLGVVLFELITGRRPIEPPPETPWTELPRILLETEPTAPSRYNRELDRDLDLIVLKALRKDRRERYSSVEQFAGYIKLYLDHRPMPEGPPLMLYRTGKFLKRNRVPVAVLTVLLLILFGGIIATQRQARIAQRRFEEVRQIATSFLFDFDREIANVKGATGARRLVVAKGLEYLDKLRRDSGNDDSLKAEIAGAYERLAEIQGNVYGNNLGQYEQAASSYGKALALRTELAATRPGDAERARALGGSYLLIADGLFTSGSTKSAVEQYRKGIAILEKLSQSGENTSSGEKSLHRGYLRLCNYLLASGDHAVAIVNCKNAIVVAQRLVGATPGDAASRLALAASYAQMANALRTDKQLSEAIPQLERAISEFGKLAREQPNNNGFARNLAGAFAILGNCYSDLGEFRKSAESYRRGIETVRTMIQIDPVDVRPKTTLAYLLIRSTGILLKLGRSEEAKAANAEGLSIFRNFADSPTATPDDLNNYASFLNETSIPELKQVRVALAYAKRAVAAAKEPSLPLLSTLADAYFGAGDPIHAVDTAQRALASYPAPKGSGEAGLRADLERKLKQFSEAKVLNSRR